MYNRHKIFIKEILLTIKKTTGRFFSLIFLMALGAFALVGLKVTVPNMYHTAQHYFEKYHTADLTILATHGIDSDDRRILSDLTDVQIEYGYVLDAGIQDTYQSIRLFSNTEQLSKFELVLGSLPTKHDEIAIAYAQRHHYQLNDKIIIEEKKDEQLLVHQFKIVGFIHSTEILSQVDLGPTAVKTGNLTLYGVVLSDVFKNRDIFSIARLKFQQLSQYHAYDKNYVSSVFNYQQQVKSLLKNQPIKRKQRIEAQQRDTVIAQLANQNMTQASIVEQYLSVLPSVELPIYHVYSRREIPGSTGYKTYENNAAVIDAVGNTFPVVLYFVAALVTFTTMTRFVDEERMLIGTYKSLGYSNLNIMFKFVLYGFLASTIGTLIGVITGHFVLPTIIYTTYETSVTFPKMVLQFYPELTLMAFLLSYLSAVLPAVIVVSQTLKEKSAKLLRPKAQVKGSKILLEYIPLIWGKLKFTQKVTLRNIFRYKKRMFMTVFGVAGSVALLFTGLGIQSSVSDVANKQFEDIIQYDLVVSVKDNSDDIIQKLEASNVKVYQPIIYDEFFVNTGKNKDQQSISMMVFDNSEHVDGYIKLSNPDTHLKIALSHDGIIISEKLAKLLQVKVNDSVTLENINGEQVTFRVNGITEMYMGHFIMATTQYYRSVYQHPSTEANAFLVKLNNSESLNGVANELLMLNGVSGIGQNVVFKKQIQTIVKALDKVMAVLVIASMLLCTVILYNLIHVNVSERLRELSTIKVLGFFDKEVTLYIYKETIVLSCIGVLGGFVVGHFLHRLIIERIPPDNILFSTRVDVYVYAIPFMMIVMLVILLAFIVHFWLKKVNMLEALKSVD